MVVMLQRKLAQIATTEAYSGVRNEGNWQVKHIMNMLANKNEQGTDKQT